MLKPIVTEKASHQLTENTYVFEVIEDRNKVEIKAFVESEFKVTVKNVNVLNRKGKKRQRGRVAGKTKDRRLAYVSIEKGQTIEKIKSLY